MEITARQALLQRILAMDNEIDRKQYEQIKNLVAEAFLGRQAAKFRGKFAGKQQGFMPDASDADKKSARKTLSILKTFQQKIEALRDEFRKDIQALNLQEDPKAKALFDDFTNISQRFRDANMAIVKGEEWPPNEQAQAPAETPQAAPSPSQPRGQRVARQGMRTFFAKSTSLNNLQASKLAAAVEQDLGIVKEGRTPKEMPKTVAYIQSLPANLQKSAIKGVVDWLKSTEFALGRESSIKLKQGNKPQPKNDKQAKASEWPNEAAENSKMLLNTNDLAGFGKVYDMLLRKYSEAARKIGTYSWQEVEKKIKTNSAPDSVAKMITNFGRNDIAIRKKFYELLIAEVEKQKKQSSPASAGSIAALADKFPSAGGSRKGGQAGNNRLSEEKLKRLPEILTQHLQTIKNTKTGTNK